MTELIDGMTKLELSQPLPDEIFYKIFDIEDTVDRSQYIEMMRNQARMLKRTNEFNNLLKAFMTDYQQRMHRTDNMTRFTGQPMELCCGKWIANDSGIYTEKMDKNGFMIKIMACPHPILPVDILENVDTGESRVTLAYFKYGEWRKITVNKEVCADNSAIVKTLGKYAIDITSENARYLVQYISDCIGFNPAVLKPRQSINRLGWTGNAFMPYAEDIVFDGGPEYEPVYRNIRENGDYETWRSHCLGLRKNRIVRLAFAASAASVLIEKVHALPFVFHVWSGESGTGKTVAIMAAMSIWGNPKMGGLVKTMNTTKVGIMRSAAFLHSIPFAGDELQTMKDRWTTNFDQLIYQITEGVDKVRGKARGGIEETMTWHNSFLFTGEEPITKANSRSGSKNRVIEVEATEQLIENGNQTVSILLANHGFAGHKIIEYLQGADQEALWQEYKDYFDRLCQMDTTEKQAMAMACILIADRILTDLIFTEESPLTVKDVSLYLRSAKEVDIAGRAYEAVLNWIAKNPVRFQNPSLPEAVNKGEVWGKIDLPDRPSVSPVASVNKDVLCDFLEHSGFDYAAVSRKWAAEGHLIRNSQGKFIHNTKVFGIKANYVKIVLPSDGDEDGFVSIQDEQMELPFT